MWLVVMNNTYDDAWHHLEASCRKPERLLNGWSAGGAFQASNARNLNIVYRTALSHPISVHIIYIMLNMVYQ